MPKYLIELERSQKYSDMIKLLVEIQRYLDGWTPPDAEGSPPDRLAPNTSKIPIRQYIHYWTKSIPSIISTLQPLSDATSRDDGVKESCSNCRNWRQSTWTCRLHPGVPVHVPSFLRETRLLTLRPHAESDDWCAQWKQGGVK